MSMSGDAAALVSDRNRPVDAFAVKSIIRLVVEFSVTFAGCSGYARLKGHVSPRLEAFSSW